MDGVVMGGGFEYSNSYFKRLVQCRGNKRLFLLLKKIDLMYAMCLAQSHQNEKRSTRCDIHQKWLFYCPSV
jgi:hypothetical protein